MSGNPHMLHASCVAIDGRGVLLLGKSGAGKSDLALRLIDRGAALVADDQVAVARRGKRLVGAPHARIAGLLEVRGVGLLQLAYMAEAPLALAVKLVSRKKVERLPEPAFFDCEDIRLPLLSLHAFDRSTEAKIRMVLKTGRL